MSRAKYYIDDRPVGEVPVSQAVVWLFKAVTYLLYCEVKRGN